MTRIHVLQLIGRKASIFFPQFMTGKIIIVMNFYWRTISIACQSALQYMHIKSNNVGNTQLVKRLYKSKKIKLIQQKQVFSQIVKQLSKSKKCIYRTAYDCPKAKHTLPSRLNSLAYALYQGFDGNPCTIQGIKRQWLPPLKSLWYPCGQI